MLNAIFNATFALKKLEKGCVNSVTVRKLGCVKFVPFKRNRLVFNVYKTCFFKKNNTLRQILRVKIVIYFSCVYSDTLSFGISALSTPTASLIASASFFVFPPL